MSEQQWLTATQFKVLKEFLNSNGVLKNLKFSPGVSVDENFGGVIVKASVCDAKKSELSYIIKCTPPSDILHSLIPLKVCYTIEIYLYSKVFAEFTKIQEERKIGKLFKPYPQFYTSLNKDREEMLVLQNVKDLGYVHQKRHLPLDYNHILLIVKHYAKIHALSYAIRDQKPEVYEEFEKNLSNHFYNFNFDGILMVSQHRVLSAHKALDPVKDVQFYKQFSYFAENMKSILTNIMEYRSQYGVVCHVDCGIMNFLFKYEIPGYPTDAMILDWQHARIGSPAVDLITLIFSAGDDSTIECFDDLVLKYYDCLASCLKELGSDANKLLPFTVLQEELKTSGISGLFMAILLIYVYSTSDQELPDTSNDESHADGFSFMYQLENSTHFNRRVRSAISHFHKLGYSFS